MSEAPPIREGLIAEDDKGAYLIGGRCGSCGFVSLGLREACPECWQRDGLAAVPIGRRGRLYSRTVIYTVPSGFAAPLTVGYVDLDEGPRIFAQLADAPEIDAPVELTIGIVKRDEDGTERLGPIYRRQA